MRKIRFFCILAAVLLCFLVSGCKENAFQNGKLNIVALGFSHYDFARAVAGDNANITMLLKPGSESHSFEPTPHDIKNIENCDVFIYTGGESDAWAEEILKSVDTKGIRKIKFTDYVNLYKEEDVSDAHAQEEYDEHVWTSPENAVKLVNAIASAIKGIDKENAAVYEENREKYISEIENLDAEILKAVSESKNKTLVFADRFPLLYFVKEFGLNYKAAFSGCAEQTEPTPESVAGIIDYIKKKDIKIIFKIELSNGRMAESISRETGVKVYTFYSCHNVSKDDFERGETYVSLMKRNLNSIKEAIG